MNIYLVELYTTWKMRPIIQKNLLIAGSIFKIIVLGVVSDETKANNEKNCGETQSVW